MSDREVRGHFTNTIAQDFLDLFAAEIISEGSTRTVYRSINRDYVIKFETYAKRFQNVVEWETWSIAKHTKFKDWFCPCSDISSNGTILIQRFARDLEEAEWPKELPSFFADVKPENFGWLDGKVVCRDYGNSYLIDKGFSSKMTKVQW